MKVRIFKFLGAVFNKDGRSETELDSHISAASRLHGAIKQKFLEKREILKETKLAV